MKNVTVYFDITVAVILIIFIPVIWINSKYSAVAVDLAKKTTEEFVDKITKNGYITQDDYVKFVSDLNKTGNVYDIELIHTQQKYEPDIERDANGVPVLDGSGNPIPIPGEVVVYTDKTYTDGIVDFWQNGKLQNSNSSPIYFMEVGDGFAVQLQEVGSGGIMKFLGMAIAGVKDYQYESAQVSNMGPEYYRSGAFVKVP